MTLWEALVGEPPFRAPSYLELGRQKCFGAPEWPANGPALPRRIIDAMRRGLAPKPSDRWPSMEALLGVLAYDPAQQRSRWVRTFGGLGLLAAVGVGWQWWAAARVERCTGAVERLGSAWDDTRRAAAESAVLGVGADYAGRVWERTAAELDAYATAWTTMHTEACEATTLRGEQSAAVMDLRMVCLDRARVELDVTTTILADADAQVVQKAHELVAGLPPLSRCADVEALRAAVEPPRPEEAAAVEDIRTRLAEAKAMGRAGRHADARAAVEATKPSLATVEYGPVHTEVTLAEGSALEDVGEYQPAEAALRRALALAYAWRQWDEVARASHELMFVVGYRLQHMDEALRYREAVEGLVKGDARREAELRNTVGGILRVHGKLAEAEHRAALALQEQVLPPEHYELANSHNSLATVLFDQGKYAEAEAEAEARLGLMLREQGLGPEHPLVAVSRSSCWRAPNPRTRVPKRHGNRRSGAVSSGSTAVRCSCSPTPTCCDASDGSTGHYSRLVGFLLKNLRKKRGGAITNALAAQGTPASVAWSRMKQ